MSNAWTLQAQSDSIFSGIHRPWVGSSSMRDIRCTFSNYVMIAGEVQAGTDVMYLFDLPNRNVHVITPVRIANGVSLQWRASRSLQRDLRP